jgi:hypothetical protein
MPPAPVPAPAAPDLYTGPADYRRRTRTATRHTPGHHLPMDVR